MSFSLLASLKPALVPLPIVSLIVNKSQPIEPIRHIMLNKHGNLVPIYDNNPQEERQPTSIVNKLMVNKSLVLLEQERNTLPTQPPLRY